MVQLATVAIVLQFIGAFFVAVFKDIVNFFLIKSPKSVKGKIVVITGGSGGIGRSLALRFCEHGATVVLLDINKEANDSAAEFLKRAGHNAFAITCDVTKLKQLESVAKDIQSRADLGDPAIVICNAGVLTVKPLTELTEQDIRRTFEVNTLGYYWTIKAFLPRMLENNYGHIVAISSIAGHFGASQSADYSGSKFAIRGLMESLKWELYDLKKNVKTTTIFPFFTKTPLLKDCQIQSNVFSLLELDQTADAILEATLKEKIEAYIPSYLSIFSNFVKSVSRFHVSLAIYDHFGIAYRPWSQ